LLHSALFIALIHVEVRLLLSYLPPPQHLFIRHCLRKQKLTSCILMHSRAVHWYLENNHGRGHETAQGGLHYKLFNRFEMCYITVLILIQRSFM
jgi:hypothetical protein